MNEGIFFAQIFFTLCCALVCLRAGREALIANAALQGLFANLFVLKQIYLFGMEVTASDAFVVGSLFTINLLREFYGKEDAKLGIRISLLSLLSFALFSQLHLLFQESPNDQAHFSYQQLLGPAPRLFFSSLVTFWVVQHFDLRLFGWLSKRFGHHSFAVRSTLSLSVSQALDTILFNFLGLYGIVSAIFDILIVSYVIKLLTILALTPLSLFLKRKYAQI